MKTTVETLCARLHDRGVRFLLIGGYALPVYGVVRQTVDIDCLVCDADEALLRSVLEAAGYMERQRTEAFVRYTHPLALEMDVDAMLVDRETFDTMFNLSSVHAVGEASARVPALAHLIALKLHAIRNNAERELRDLGDIVELLRGNPDAEPDAELQALGKLLLPKTASLDAANKALTLTQFSEWATRNYALFVNDAMLKRIRSQPSRRPARARFQI